MNTNFRSIASVAALLLFGAAFAPAQSFSISPDPSRLVQAAAPDFSNFTPVFQQDVFVINPFSPDPNTLLQRKAQVNPSYALSETSALELAVVLKDYRPTIVHCGPFGWFTSGQFTVDHAVPWFVFPDGTMYNAGLIAWYFSHGLPAALVERWVRADLDAYLKFSADHPEAYDVFAKIPRLETK